MLKIILIFICTLFLNSCNVSKDGNYNSHVNSKEEPVYRRISAKEAREIMEAADNFILLDVRTEDEFINQRIARGERIC